ncbi:hypothetical protein CTI12_AA273710 [Artemisia annua]|uniref:Reverse transcriptase domain-containing protein n=1 Tax=Artemisia annua TaxID=35608 RepID=A0A2U1NAQ3_ARTAN|nr:hypothetical protein CTI12_AA273710 [Artemisia annua]
MKFAVIRSPSPYNVILGRSGIKRLRAIPSTIHSMMKFPTPRGIATLVTRSIIVSECRKLEEKFLLKKETEADTYPEEEVKNEVVGTEEILVHPAYPDQVKKRFFSEEKNQAINRDVEEWLKAGIIRPVRYPTWLSNPRSRAVEGMRYVALFYGHVFAQLLSEAYIPAKLFLKVVYLNVERQGSVTGTFVQHFKKILKAGSCRHCNTY